MAYYNIRSFYINHNHCGLSVFCVYCILIYNALSSAKIPSLYDALAVMASVADVGGLIYKSDSCPPVANSLQADSDNDASVMPASSLLPCL